MIQVPIDFVAAFYGILNYFPVDFELLLPLEAGG